MASPNPLLLSKNPFKIQNYRPDPFGCCNLIAKYHVDVHGFDPTPESVEWIKSQALPPQFHHHPVAIAGHDGELKFALPDQLGHCPRAVNTGDQRSEVGSQRSDATGQISDLRPSPLASPHTLPATLNSPHLVTVPCRKLSSLVRELGHERIALLKMDIEGSEYDVIEDILGHHLQIDQILVEFHHRFADIGISRTIEAKNQLAKAGYRQFHLSPWCEEFVFLKS